MKNFKREKTLKNCIRIFKNWLGAPTVRRFILLILRFKKRNLINNSNAASSSSICPFFLILCVYIRLVLLGTILFFYNPFFFYFFVNEFCYVCGAGEDTKILLPIAVPVVVWWREKWFILRPPQWAYKSLMCVYTTFWTWRRKRALYEGPGTYFLRQCTSWKGHKMAHKEKLCLCVCARGAMLVEKRPP